MSFGASGSVRFEPGLSGNEHGIFWQGVAQKKPTKKFGYRKKEMKYPLRKIEHPEPKPEEKQSKNNKKNASQNFVKKNKDNTSKLMRTKDGIAKENGGYYTLTHKQLNSILESVGKIASLRGEGVNIAIEQALALQNKLTDPLTSELKIEEPTKPESEETDDGKQGNDIDKSEDWKFVHGKEDIDGDVTIRSIKPGKSTRTPRSDVHKSNESESQATGRSETNKRKTKKQKDIKENEEKSQDNREAAREVENKDEQQRFSPPPIPKSHMTKAERKRLEMQQNTDNGSAEAVQKPDLASSMKRRDRNPLTNSGDNESEPIKFHIPPLIPKAHLTMAEKKRLQWEIERGQTINTPPSTTKLLAKSENETEKANKGETMSAEPKDVKEAYASPRTMPVPKAHLSHAERKRLQWEQERAEQNTGEYDPWGRPGAGAPIRTNSGKPLADYNSRKEQALRISLEAKREPATVLESSPVTQEAVSSKSPSRMVGSRNQAQEPAAMRSSFAIGFIAPNEERFRSTKEEERRKWLEDLEKQKEEKRLQKLAEKEKDRQYFAETWADKLTHPPHPPAPLPEQPASLTPRTDTHTQQPVVLTPRVYSAPQASAVDEDSKNYERGQGSLLDPSTRRELEEKRKRHMEHQAAVLAQVEEKQRLKQLERDRKIQEEQEEERKLQQERDRLQNQYADEQKKSRLKEEARQQRLLELKNAMDEAQFSAQQEKNSKRMQHLQQGGHDIKRLQANLEANFTPRPTVRHVEPTSVPGLDLTPRPWHPGSEQPSAVHTQVAPHGPSTERYQHEPYTENRVLTPSMFRKPVTDPLSPRREFATQTESDLLKEGFGREDSEVSIVYKNKKPPAQNKKVRVKSAENAENNLNSENQKPPIGKRGPVKLNERPKWGVRNASQGKTRKQSEKDPFYQRKNEERKERRAKRERELLALVEANKRVIPGERAPEESTARRGQAQAHSTGHHENALRLQEDDQYVFTERSGQYDNLDSIRERRTQSPPTRRSKDKSPTRTNQYRGDSRTTVVHHPSSPPIPALRHKMDIWKDPKEFVNDYHLENHNYSNYHNPRIEQLHAKAVQSHYQDDDLFEDAPFEASDFVPFTRTSEILDPGRAAVPVMVSRESSAVAKARQEYHKGQRPGNHGNQMEYYDDKKYEVVSPLQKDPIFNPNVIKGHPTPRQDLILQQLSHLKHNLMQRQRELETCMSPSDLNQPKEDHI